MSESTIKNSTISLSRAPSVAGFASVVGRKEGEGPLRARFDEIVPDAHAGQKSWEQAESAMLRRALAEPCALLVLDEACAALALGMVDEALLKDAVQRRPAAREVCLTGRDPAPWMREAADYLTEMRCVRHPFAQGIAARRGVEF